MLKVFPQNQALSEALDAEISGNYALAFELLSPFLKVVNEPPRTEGFSEGEAAEIFLRCGSVVGFLGRSRQINNAQEISRNLLTEACLRYEKLGIKEKIAECQNHLALTFERTGSIARARNHLEKAFEIEVPQTHPIRLYSHIIDSLLNLADKNYLIILEKFAPLESIFLEHANFLYRGCFFNNYGLALKNLGQTDDALEKLLTARYYFTKAENFVYCGLLENNLARLFCSDGKYVEAHHFAQKADNTYKLVGDISRRGFTFNTRAEIFLAEKEFKKALETVEKGLAILEDNENLYYLVKTYSTKILVLLKLGETKEAKQTAQRAFQKIEKLDENTGNKLMAEIKSLFDEQT